MNRSPRTRTAASLLALFVATLVLAGCGMRGPLYLPERPAPEKQPAESQAPRSFLSDASSVRLS